MTKNSDVASRMVDEDVSQRVTRRLWLQSAACTAVGASLFSFSPKVVAQTQAPPLAYLIRAMTALTGVRIEENWIGSTAGLVGIILDSSKGMRELDLGEIEPLNDFLLR
jgi:hypothetical protein